MNDEMTIQEYDVLVLRNQQAEAERRHRRSLNRWRHGSMAVGYLAAAAAVLGTVCRVWQAVAGPSATDVLEDRQKRECIVAHGSWLRVDTGADSTYGTCFGDGEAP
jgi:hypothetical protein